MAPSNTNRGGVRRRPPDNEADPDSDVLGLVANDDMTGAVQLLMKRHGAAVFRYCSEALRDAILAEDVLQRVFLAAFHDLKTFSGRSSVRTWLFGVAHHRVLDAAKSRNRQRSHVEGDGMVDIPDARPSAGERLDDARLNAALTECVSGLPEAVREVLLLHYQAGFTFEDIAEICDEKAGTLEARVRRALPRLRACIEDRTGGAV